MPPTTAQAQFSASPWRARLAQRFQLYSDSEPMAPEFRVKQLQLVLRLTPWTMLVNLLNAVLVCIIFWHSASPWLLAGWLALIVLAAAAGLQAWRRPQRRTVSPRALHHATMQATLLALLWGLMTILLFRAASPPQQLLLATLVTGMMSAGGFALTTLPVAGTAWVFILTLAALIALITADFPLALPVSLLLLLYGFILSAVLWSQARTLCARLVAESKAEASNRAKSVFLSRMSHELRTPLTAILGYSQLLSMEENVSPETREGVKEIEMAGQHLLTLINDLLDLASIESGKLEMSVKDTVLVDVLSQVRRIMAPQAHKRGLTLDIPELRALLLADALRLRQVLINLISNAIKYNRAGGQVLVRGELRPAQRYRISVRDTGHGIPAERMGELFKLFHRIDAERDSIEGTGIGLVISKNLVEAMGGQIGVESTVGQGSVFWVELPLAASPAPSG